MHQFVLIFLMGFSLKRRLTFAAEDKIIQKHCCSLQGRRVTFTFGLLFHNSVFPAQVDLITQQQGFPPNHLCC